MGIVSRFERRLQGAVGDAFARVFGGSVVPQEVEAALQQQAADHIQQLEGGHQLAPNSYVITLNESDHAQLASDHEMTSRSFSRHLADYIREQGWQTYGDVHIEFEASAALHTGQFRTSGRVDPDAGRHQPPAAAPIAPPPHARPPQPGAGPMTHDSGYDPGREPVEPADDDQRHEPPVAEHDPGYGRRGYDDRYQQDPPAARQYQGGQGQQAYGGFQNGYDQEQGRAPGGYPPAGGRGYPPPPPQYDRGGYPDPRAGQYQDRGYDAPGRQPDYPPQRYPDEGYRDQGYPERNYADQGYGDRDYAEPGYTDQPYSDRDYPRQDHRGPDQGYGDPGYRDQGYAEPGYPDRGYREPQGYPPENRGGYDRGYGAQPGYGQPAAYAAQPGSGYADQDYAAAAYSATLQLDDGSGRTYQLREGSNVIGRGQDAHFRLPDTGVSRRHIEIRWDGQVAMLSDLGSTNGTLVNGAPVQDWQLADGDLIRAGHSEILIRIL